MDKTIPEWLRRFRGMKPEQMCNAWESKAKVDLTWTQECNFHAAAAERMKQLGNLSIDLDDKTRENLCRRADEILTKLQRHLKDKPEKLAEIEAVVKESDEYYQNYGSRTARYYMFEQGIIDEWGDRKKA